MYFLLVFQLLSTDVAGWVQLGAYETESQCNTVAKAVHEVNEKTTLAFLCVPSKEVGKNV